MKAYIKNWKEIEDKLGITAWEEARNTISKLISKIKELTKSRDKWKEKYLKTTQERKNK